MERKIYKLENGTIDIYFQKSYKFIYPLLNICLSHKILPIQTYMIWNGIVGFNDNKIICVYQNIKSVEFNQFAKSILLNNPFFENFKECEGNKIAYTFNLNKHSESITQFLRGSYSLMSLENK